MNDIMTLRNYIDNIKNIDASTRIETFCRLMKIVSEAIEKEERNIIRINLDEIQINAKTNEIILPEQLFSNELDKTMAGFNTGISLMADRKSTNEHKKVAFALMILGWYVNPNGDAIHSDIEVLENFDEYMSKVPNWLHDFFINIFRKMDYTTSFNDYYQINFIDKVNNDIKEAFLPYNLTDEQLKRITSLVIKETKRMIKEGEVHE